MAPVKLTDKDIDYLVRLVATEADSKLVWSHPEEYSAQVHGIVDTVLNRVASGKWGDTVADVANAKLQFSKINGPKSQDPYGSVDKVPDSAIPAFLPNIVTSWVTERSAGTPSSVGGNLHYANPTFSDASNMGWINALDGPKLGYGDSTHWHGTTAGFTPVEASVEYGPRAPTDILQTLHDRLDEARGFGEIAPRPAIRSDVLTELRDRAQGVAAAGITPRLVMAEDQPVGRIDTPLAPGMLPEESGIYAGGIGSLLTDPMSPAAMNPRPQLLAEQLGVRPLEAPPSASAAPTMAQLAAMRDVSMLDMPPLPRPRPQAPVQAPPVQAAPQTSAPVSAPQIALNKDGKPVEIGKSYTLGGYVYTGKVGPDGVGYLDKVPVSAFGGMGPGTVAGGMIESGMADAIADVTQQTAAAAPILVDSVREAAGGLADSVGGFFGGLFGGNKDVLPAVSTVPSANANLDTARAEQAAQRRPTTVAPTIAPVSANANLSSARSEQSSQRSPVSAPTRTLPPAVQTADSVARNAISAVPRPVAPTMTSVPVTTTVPNPAYADWQRRYGDGSQVQTAATGGMVTRDQLAAIQNVGGAVQAPIRPVAPPPPPPMTITRVTTRMVPTNPAAPVTMTHDKTTAPSLGAMTPVQRLQASGLSAEQAYAVAVSRNNSGTGTTSSGQPRTASDGTSWAANW